MTAEEKDTEELIFEAASRVFQRKGYAGARMQEIADEADINKSMLHYYYRSKDKLFKMVYQKEMRRFFPVIYRVLGSDLPFDEKIEQLIDTYYSFLNDNPKMPQFIIYELNQNPDRLQKFIKETDIEPPESFFKQVQSEISNGRMDEVDPKQLLTSIVGLILFPFMAQKMIQGLLQLERDDFRTFLGERKEFLYNFILNGINYKK